MSLMNTSGSNVNSGSFNDNGGLGVPPLCAIAFATTTDGGANTAVPNGESSMGFWADGSSQCCASLATTNGVTSANAISRSYFDTSAFTRVMTPSGTVKGRTSCSAGAAGVRLDDLTGGAATSTVNHRIIQFSGDMVENAFCGTSTSFMDTDQSVNVGFQPDIVFFMSSELSNTLNSSIRQSFGFTARGIGFNGSNTGNRAAGWGVRTGVITNGAMRSQGYVSLALDESQVYNKMAATMTQTGFDITNTTPFGNMSVGYLAIKWKPGISQKPGNTNLNSGATSIDNSALQQPILGMLGIFQDMGGGSSDVLSTTGEAWMYTVGWDSTESGLSGQLLNNQQIGYSYLSGPATSETYAHRGGGRRLFIRDGTLTQAATFETTAVGWSMSGFPGTTTNTILGMAVSWGQYTPTPPQIFLGGQQVQSMWYNGRYVSQVFKGSTQLYP